MKIVNFIIVFGCKEIFILIIKILCSCIFNIEIFCLVVVIKILFFLLLFYIVIVIFLYLCSVVFFGYF